MFVWETDLLNELLVVVSRYSRVDREDRWFWTLSPDSQCSVKSAYTHLLNGLVGSDAPAGEIL